MSFLKVKFVLSVSSIKKKKRERGERNESMYANTNTRCIISHMELSHN